MSLRLGTDVVWDFFDALDAVKIYLRFLKRDYAISTRWKNWGQRVSKWSNTLPWRRFAEHLSGNLSHQTRETQICHFNRVLVTYFNADYAHLLWRVYVLLRTRYTRKENLGKCQFWKKGWLWNASKIRYYFGFLCFKVQNSRHSCTSTFDLSHPSPFRVLMDIT